MPGKKAPPSKQSVAFVEKTIANVALAPLRSWLKGKDLPYSGARKTFIPLLARLIDSGELTESQLENAVIGIEESGGKRIIFFELQEIEDQKLDIADVKTRLKAEGVSVTDQRRLAPSGASKPKLVYAIASGTNVRVKWVETHEEPKVDLHTDTVNWVDVRKVIVLEADLTKKQAQIRCDPPGKKHPHGQGKGPKSPESYFSSYKAQAEAILGCTLNASELRPALRSLLEAEPRVVRVRIEEHTNERRTRVKYTAREGDVRDDPEWKQPHSSAGSKWAYDAPAFDWLMEQSSGKLKREVFSAADASSSTLRVPADCHEDEVEYAIGQIRTRQTGTTDAGAANK